MRRLRASVRDHPEVLRSTPVESVRTAAAAGPEAAVVAGDSVQGQRVVHHRLRAQGPGGDLAPKSKGDGRRRSRRPRPRQSPRRKPRAKRSRQSPSRRSESKGHGRAPSASGRSRRRVFKRFGDVPRYFRLPATSRYARNLSARSGRPTRSRRPPSGSRACCRCRGGRP